MQQKQKFLDFSIGSTYMSCHEKARLAYHSHLQPLVTEKPLVFGHAIHAGIHAKYIVQSRGGNFEQQEEAAIKAYLHDLKEQHADLPLSIDDEEKRSVERGMNILRAYMTRWKDEQVIPFKGASGEPYVEIGFSIYLCDHGGVPVMLVGRIDRIMESLLDGTIHVTDTKTSSGSIYHVQNSVRPNHQASIYYHAASNILGREISSVVFDAIYISDRKPDFKKGGWLAEGVDIDKDFGRFPTMRNTVDIDEALQDFRDIAQDYFDDIAAIESGKRKRLLRNAPSACTQYGRCKYKEICETNGNESIIANNFVVSPWEPFEGLVKKEEIA